VVYKNLSSTPRAVDYCRNVFIAAASISEGSGGGDVHGAALFVLNIASAPFTKLRNPESGSWIAIRLFPQGLPAVEAALDQILEWVKAIAEGISGIVDIIIAYIEFLEARILELEALISRIIALLNSLALFELPSVNGLVVTGAGTDGILTGLVTAEDKPFDGPEAYGGGLVVLAGGLPSILVEILKAFFPESQ
jgi:hypothetical protein